MDGRWAPSVAVFLLACSTGVGPLGPGVSSDGDVGAPASDAGGGHSEAGGSDGSEAVPDLGSADLDGGASELGPIDLGPPDQGTTLRIDPLHLPGAVVGVPYRAALTAIGGSGSGHRWSVVQGNLPNGLALSSAGPVAELGGIARIPLGHYPIVVEVEDDLGQRAQAAYDLAVREDQPDWVAVLGDLEVDGVDRPYLIDLTPTVPTWFAIPPAVPVGVVTTGTIALSPDQRWVAWTSDHEQPPARALYLAFATSAGAGQRVTVLGHDVSLVAWSADSTRLFYATGDQLGMVRSDEQPLVVPLPQALYSGAVRSVRQTGVAPWMLVETDLAVCIVQLGASFDASICSDLFAPGDPPRPFSSHLVADQMRILFLSHAQGAWFLTRWSPFHWRWTWEWLFADYFYPDEPILHAYSPDGAHLAARAARDRSVERDLYVMSGLSFDWPVVRRVSTDLGLGVEVDPGFVWASDSRRLVFRTGPADPAAYLVDTSSTSTPTPTRFDLPLAAGPRQIRSVGFGPNGDWVWYQPEAPGPNGLVLRRLNGLNLGPELVARPATLSSTVPLVRHHFSADGQSLLTAHGGNDADLLHVFDLSGSGVGPGRPVRGLPKGGRLGEVRQPRDGSRVLFTYGPADPAERQLYLIELRSPIVVATHLGPPPIPGASVKLVDVTISR